MLGMIYNGLWTDGFVERGNSLLGINSASANIAATKGYVGGRAYRSFVTGNGVELTPELRARAVYDFLNDPRAFNATFTADPTATSFAVSGLQPNRTSAIVGTGVTAKFATRWQVFANYDAEVRGGSVAHIGSAGIKVIW
jgi:outer membrane autotransporter protein